MASVGITRITISGADAGNYVLLDTTAATASTTAAPGQGDCIGAGSSVSCTAGVLQAGQGQ